MGLLDEILGQMTGGQGAAGIADLAAKVGLTPEQAESAVGALANAHTQPGDTVQTASNTTGMSPDIMQQLMGHLGGESGLAGIASGFLRKGGSIST